MKSTSQQIQDAGQSKTSQVIEWLRFEFTSRTQKNPHYSLRSFAKFLGVSHTLLSLVLNGQRKPSKQLIEKLAERLCLDPQKKNEILSQTPNRKSSKSIPFNKISLDRFAMISEWQHYAILSLLAIPDTELTPQFIARRLNISESLARISLKRLFELDYIDKDEKTGRWKQSTAPIIVENTESTVYTRVFQTQLLNKAIESMENDPIELRDLSSTTFAMNPKHVEYALKRIREFRRQLTDELEAFGQPEEVYNLTVQICPCSKRSSR